MSTRSRLKIAVVCSSNLNRSMEAHELLSKNGFNVRSFGTGEKVKLPSPGPSKPITFDFGCTYEQIFRELVEKNEAFYSRTGILNILDRNMKIKPGPEKFQLCDETFDIIITCDSRVYDRVIEALTARPEKEDPKPVYIVNLNVADNRDGAFFGAYLILDLVAKMCASEDLGSSVHQICQNFEREYEQHLVYCVLPN